jgi:hypothetical protein
MNACRPARCWSAILAFVSLCAFCSAEEIASTAPKAADVLEVCNFPPSFFRPDQPVLKVSRLLIEKFLKEGRVLAGDMQSEVIGEFPLTLNSGELIGSDEQIRKAREKYDQTGDLTGRTDAHGTIRTKQNEIFFYELYNDRSLAVYRNSGERSILVLDN